MPYICKIQGGKAIKYKKGTKGNYTKVSEHDSMAKCRASIRATYAGGYPAKGTNVVDLIGTISPEHAAISSAIRTCPKGTVLRIHSKGGSVVAGLSIFNAILEAKCGTHIDGMAASMGAIIALAGSPVTMTENSLLVIHSPRINMEGTYTPEDLEEEKVALDKTKKILIDTIRAKTGKSEKQIEKWMAKDTYFTAEEAFDAGLIDDIIPIYSQIDISAMDVPERIVAFLNSCKKEKELMSLQDVAGKLNLEISDDAKPEAIEDSIVAAFGESSKTIGDLQKKLKELEEKSKKDPPSDPIKVPQAFIDREKKYRRQELSAVVAEGKLVPAVTKEFETIFCGDLPFDAEGNITDNFDAVVAALKKNDAVLSFGGKTKPQAHPDGKDAPSLLRDIENRLKGGKS